MNAGEITESGFYWVGYFGEWEVVDIRCGNVWFSGSEKPEPLADFIPKENYKFIGPIQPPSEETK